MTTKTYAGRVYLLGSDPVVRFAAQELARYLKEISGSEIKVAKAKAYNKTREGWWVGLATDYTADSVKPSGNDDVIYVDAVKGHAVLSGSNGRAALYAVYRYLEELGCCWIRPGANGERLPRIAKPQTRRVALIEKPSARHRCICIEGSCAVEHVKAMIDYAAKRGFNGYFTQFRNSYTFFDRWYGMERHRKIKRTPFSSEAAHKHQETVKKEALKRGMMLHAVGHGWTCEPFGIKGEEWSAAGDKVSPEVAQYLAEVAGKRDLWRGVALNTQLCFSQLKVRELFTDAIVEYAQEHPLEEYIHVWQADGSNNHCECAECAKAIPSDWYVASLNLLDEKLTAAGLKTKIVFLAYFDLLWAPRKEKIANPERFVLMFAPITRSYANSFMSDKNSEPAPVPPYRRNKLEFPTAPADNLAMLAKWRRKFSGECVDFDYHLWGSSYSDPGQMALARVIHEDATGLGKMGMDGFISCQNQRVSFPTGITMEALGRGLWCADETFDEMASRYFHKVYGAKGTLVRLYLEEVSRAISRDLYTAPREPEKTEGIGQMRRASRKWLRIAELTAEMQPVIDKGVKSRDKIVAETWRALDHYAWFVVNYADFQRLAWRGDAAASAKYDEIADELDRRLPLLHDMLDTWSLKLQMQRTLWINGLPFTERIALPRP